MLDIAIIGGGPCGLALGHSLHARRLDWQLFEARSRLGGRVLTVQSSGGLPLDLGATWYWPASQPSMGRLVADLDLASMAQPDDGRVRLLDDPNRPPRTLAFDAATGTLAADEATPARPGALHGGARRLAGGMGALTDALAAGLPATRVHRGQVLKTLVDRGDHVELRFEQGGQAHHLAARRVVLALPPRLAAASMRFAPALPAATWLAMQATPTWMACAAKAALALPGTPAWRREAAAGNAWVNHPQAVLAEVFDAGPPDPATGAALAGFLALTAARRPAFRRGLPMLIESQLVALYGAGLAAGELHAQDWAEEVFTSTEADLADDSAGGAHPAYGASGLQHPLWQGRLWLGGSETARHGGGYLEGALAAAARLRSALSAAAHDAASA